MNSYMSAIIALMQAMSTLRQGQNNEGSSTVQSLSKNKIWTANAYVILASFNAVFLLPQVQLTEKFIPSRKVNVSFAFPLRCRSSHTKHNHLHTDPKSHVKFHQHAPSYLFRMSHARCI